ncbi:MAG: 4Fe-4S dicluster domain-containing protein [Planctomycetota bacterium]
MSTVDDIRQLARDLLREGKVALVIGYERGTLPMRSRPAFVRTEAEADRLMWDPWCEADLVRYLHDRKEKTAVVAKACDVRAIVAAIKEKQIKRDNVVIIAVRCGGILDRRRAEQIVKGRRLTAAVIEGETLVLNGDGFEERVLCSAVLREECLYCADPAPVEADHVVGPEVKPRAAEDEYADVAAFEKKSPEERWRWFYREIEKCIRCYACRSACPMCYCSECFADSSDPEWIGRGDDLVDKQFFHIVRAFHTAGRCVDCGACERACPMGIKLRMLTRKIQKDVKELFGGEAGKDMDSPPALAAFDPKKDKDDFTG